MLYRLLIAVFLVLASVGAQASHLIGGYMSYEFLRTQPNNNKLYKISLTLFRDVDNGKIDFDNDIEIGVYLNNTTRDRNQLLNVRLLYTKPVRPPGSEDCDFYAKNRIEMGVYETTVELAPYPQGYHLYFVRCCRNVQENLTDKGGEADQGQTYYCFIPNPALENSSPFFSGVPSPYMCNNDTNAFLNRAVDPDGDSLVYRFVHPWQGGGATLSQDKPTPPNNLKLPIDKVQYRTGFNTAIPFGSTGYTSLNSSNGLTHLSGRTPGKYAIAIEVEEYRNGVSLGAVRLDMQIIVIDCPPNKQPELSNQGGTFFEIEVGQKLCFDVFASDPDDNPVQAVTVYGTGDIISGDNGAKPPYATIATKTGLGNVETEFCWTPSCDQARDQPYWVTLSTYDNGCLVKTDEYNVEIKVNPFEGTTQIQGTQRVCADNNEAYAFNAVNGKATSTYWWSVDKGQIIGKNDSSSVRIEFSGSGKATIKMIEISQYGCEGDTGYYSVDLVQAPATPTITGSDTVCLGATNVQYTVPGNTGSTYTWLWPNGQRVDVPFNTIAQNFNTLGDFKLQVVEKNQDGCASDTGEITINVRKPKPTLVGPLSVCPNSSNVAYGAIGHPASTYTWAITGGSQSSGGSSKDITVDWGNEGLGTVMIVETDKWGCVSEPEVTFINITYDLDGATPIGDNSVCEYDANVPYFVPAANGSKYTWFISGGNQVAGDSTSNIEVTWGAAGQGLVSVQQFAYDSVNNKACLSPIVDLKVTINPTPTADQIEGDFEVCASLDGHTYTVNGFSGSTYQWTVNGSNQNILGQGTNQITVVWPTAGSFTISVLETSKDSCPGVVIDSVVLVHPTPSADEILGPQVVCAPNFTNITYSVMALPNSTLDWSITDGDLVSANGDSARFDLPDQGTTFVKVFETTEFGCTSDTVVKEIYVNNVQMDIERVTVGFPDNHVLGQINLSGDGIVGSFFRTEGRHADPELNWNTIYSSNHQNFVHANVDTDKKPLEYIVSVEDLCGVTHTSTRHQTINLTGQQMPDGMNMELQFSPYVGWTSVDRYELHKSSNSSPIWQYVQDAATGEQINVMGNQQDFRQCFRIKAYKSNSATISWSNEICFVFSPDVYVPTAFSPNKDALNDTFHPVTIAVQDYHMSIYNRWGQKIYETFDQNLGWDGDVNDKPSPAGVYMYIIQFSDAQGERFQKAGTFHMIR